ncbi:hypothetical protein PCNPT3_08545 [Psychromonas sp. CNPT3]|nr:hypothetical protein PCNPT3_08545 [Psychromonas sp. CNPT3]
MCVSKNAAEYTVSLFLLLYLGPGGENVGPWCRVVIAFFVLGFVLDLSGVGDVADILINIASIVLSIVFGVNGNSWREKNLISIASLCFLGAQ